MNLVVGAEFNRLGRLGELLLSVLGLVEGSRYPVQIDIGYRREHYNTID